MEVASKAREVAWIQRTDLGDQKAARKIGHPNANACYTKGPNHMFSWVWLFA
jgi:hypothetical protein